MVDKQVPELITVAEAASRIGVPRARFGQWVSWGTLNEEQGVRRLGRAIRIDWTVFDSAFEAWKTAHPAAWHSDGVSLSTRNAAARHVRVTTRGLLASEPDRAKGGRIEHTSSTEQSARREKGTALDSDPVFITVREAARRLSLHPETIYSWVASGRYGARQGIHHIGRAVRIEWEVLCAAVRTGRL